MTPLDLLPAGVPRHGDLYDNVTLSARLGADLSPMFGTSLIARHTDATLNFQGQTISPPRLRRRSRSRRNFNFVPGAMCG